MLAQAHDGQTFEDMSESEQEFALLHSIAVLEPYGNRRHT